MDLQNMLGKIGLSTREEFDRSQAKKEVWHSLVRDVFARYYLKLREAFPDQLPNPPRKYSPGWEQHIKDELDRFLDTDLQNIDPLLRACGFGTEKWEQFVAETLPEMNSIVDSHLRGELHNGEAPGTDAELAEELSEARREIRQLRSAGYRALARLRDYERQLAERREEDTTAAPPSEEGESFTALFPGYAHSANGDDEDDYTSETDGGDPAVLFDDISESSADPAVSAAFFANDEQQAPDNDDPDSADHASPDEDEKSARADSPEEPTDQDWAELQRQNEELRAKMALREKKIDALNNQLEDMEEDMRLVRPSG